jgi:hypothetical protein
VSITLAQLGLFHEYGTVNMPARPFLIPALQEQRSYLQGFTRNLLTRVVRGQMTKREALGKLGGEGEAIVKNKIRTGPFEPLKESTKRRKTVAGKRGDTPLIDTGQMQQNVQWEYDTE